MEVFDGSDAVLFPVDGDGPSFQFSGVVVGGGDGCDGSSSGDGEPVGRVEVLGVEVFEFVDEIGIFYLEQVGVPVQEHVRDQLPEAEGGVPFPDGSELGENSVFGVVGIGSLPCPSGVHSVSRVIDPSGWMIRTGLCCLRAYRMVAQVPERGSSGPAGAAMRMPVSSTMSWLRSR